MCVGGSGKVLEDEGGGGRVSSQLVDSLKDDGGDNRVTY